MNRLLRISSLILGAFVLIAITLVVLRSYFNTGNQSQVPAEVYSPDRSKIIIPRVNSDKDNYDTYLLVHLEIQDVQSRRTLFEVQTRASDRMRWSVDWIDDSTVKLDSSDIGSYCWAEGKNDTWTEIPCP